jgi:hypothetical protein
VRWKTLQDVGFHHNGRICVNAFFSLPIAATAFSGNLLNKRNFSEPRVGVDSDFQE